MMVVTLFNSVLYRFGLFEAMSAIEMMDPKMDAGMIFNKDKNMLSFKEAVKVTRQPYFFMRNEHLAQKRCGSKWLLEIIERFHFIG